MLVAMIVWGVALWYLIRLARLSSAPPAAPHRAVLLPVDPHEFSDEADAGEVLEADLVFARLTGQADVATYQEAMAALAASTASRAPDARPYGR